MIARRAPKIIRDEGPEWEIPDIWGIVHFNVDLGAHPAFSPSMGLHTGGGAGGEIEDVLFKLHPDGRTFWAINYSHYTLTFILATEEGARDFISSWQADPDIITHLFTEATPVNAYRLNPLTVTVKFNHPRPIPSIDQVDLSMWVSSVCVGKIQYSTCTYPES
jgi:hypothetical protein